jgi:SP family general alpha glucoside:H+ symporter-like MFS transporter
MPADDRSAFSLGPILRPGTANVAPEDATPPYNVLLAERAEKREREMSFRESRRADKRLILYSLGFSGTIIMEGFGLALITYLFTFKVFNEKYGEYNADEKAYEVRHNRH